MSKLSKALICSLLVTSGMLFGEESSVEKNSPTEKEEMPLNVTNSIGYFSIGVGPLPLLLPNFGLGYRFQRNHQGADISLQVATIVTITQVKANLIYDYYFKPNLNSQFYLGLGVGVSGLFENKRHWKKSTACFSPELVFGKQYQNETKDLRFTQIQISFPTFNIRKFPERKFSRKHDTFYMPLVVLSYGICF